MRPSVFSLLASIALISGALGGAQAATTANPAPDASTRAAAKTGNEFDKAVGPDRPVSGDEMAHAVSLSGIRNPAQALATAEIKNRQGEAVGTDRWTWGLTALPGQSQLM